MKDKLEKALDMFGLVIGMLGMLVVGMLMLQLSILLWNLPNTLSVICGGIIFVTACLLMTIGSLACYTIIKEKIK